ncbi:NADH-quinone oxidoreductase subunit C [Candidatus Neomarinimicrobiota bacterium]
MKSRQSGNQMLPTDQLTEYFQNKFGDDFLEVTEFRGITTIHVKGGQILKVMRTLKTDPRFAFNFLSDITAIDHLTKGGNARFSVVYHLLNQHEVRRVVVHAWVEEENCALDSVYSLWKTADWQEREVYDLFGIVFNQHPNLRRIMNPDDFQYFPLRKDYPLHGRGERGKFPVVPRHVGSKWSAEKSFE